MRESLLTWRRHRYLKWAVVVAALSVLLYASQSATGAQPPNGGTWQGYVLGTLGALLIVWLSFLGVRKRRYNSTSGTVQGWTSAHIYLGTILLLVATLHCAAQFGMNVHTLAYVLMCLVVFSGFFGLYAYMHLPRRVASNSTELTRAQWLEEMTSLDKRIRDMAARCEAILQAMALSALELTSLGGSLRRQLSARDYSRVVLPSEEGGEGKPVSNRDQVVMIDTLSRRIPNAQRQSEAEVLNELLALFGRRQFVLSTLRRDIRLKGLMKIWLFVHIPMTVALLTALSVHILSVFIYW
ncbi:MAG: hypothetical protein IMF06_15685 [Proteobacteria bacterium]|nr:hypothetical protein [Pseudomonadota bacterium]